MSLGVTPLAPDIRVVLIGGTSHTGKSTLAAAWARDLGYPLVSTDRLGRHPGRPWPSQGREVPAHVTAHYAAHSGDELLESNLAHYRGMWPVIATLVAAHATAPQGRLVLEGSGCWPDEMVAAPLGGAAAVWMVASDDLIADRIRRSAGEAGAGSALRPAIDSFVVRSQLFNRRLAERLDALGLPATEVIDGETAGQTIARCRRNLVYL